MCGDLEEDDALESDLHRRFVMRGETLLARRGPRGDDPLNDYCDRLFADLLRRCVDDAGDVEAGDAYRRMAMQSVVLARLAGFLAGHGVLTDDPLPAPRIDPLNTFHYLHRDWAETTENGAALGCVEPLR